MIIFQAVGLTDQSSLLSSTMNRLFIDAEDTSAPRVTS